MKYIFLVFLFFSCKQKILDKPIEYFVINNDTIIFNGNFDVDFSKSHFSIHYHLDTINNIATTTIIIPPVKQVIHDTLYRHKDTNIGVSNGDIIIGSN